MCFLYYYTRVNTVQYGCSIFMGIKFLWIVIGFLPMIIYEVLYTWCLRYNICSAWFLGIRILTCCGLISRLTTKNPENFIRLKNIYKHSSLISEKHSGSLFNVSGNNDMNKCKLINTNWLCIAGTTFLK